MNKEKPICILFAGPPGCSKTPIAYYLSWNLGFPIFNNDAIRTEVREDALSLKLDGDLFVRRRDTRLKQLINTSRDFVLDASIDRSWPKLKEMLEKQEYQWLIINFDLSLDFLRKLYKAKDYKELALLEKCFAEHKNFLHDYGEAINYTINDENFANRLENSLEAVKEFVNYR